MEGNWKQAVKVDKNATAIMKLSCVQRCEKRPNGEFLYRLIDGSYVFEGMWLCEDLDGRWHGFTEYEWGNEKTKE